MDPGAKHMKSRSNTYRPTTPARELGPTVAPPRPPGLTPVLDRNIRILESRRQQEELAATAEVRVADRITQFTGSMLFVYIHVVLFSLWTVANLGFIPHVNPWDPTFVILGTSASVEAIFLSTFVLISQNRMARSAEKRADLDLQINLLSEHEITKLVALTAAIAEHMGLETEVDQEVGELQRDVAPEQVLDEIETRKSQLNSS
jgi:uncharacterized membrane protein